MKTLRPIAPSLSALLLALLTLAPLGARAQTATPPAGNGSESGAALDALRSRIGARLLSPEIRRGQVGIKAVSLATGKVVFESNSEKYFMPASNMKNFTVATALERLSPDFRFITSVYARSRPGANGVVAGPLRVYGRGDISISYNFNDDDPFKGIDRLVDAIAAAGVKRIEGDIVGDETYFRGSPLPTGWEWDDLQFYYGAEVSALPVNDNVVRLSVTPGPPGYGCSVRLQPSHLLFRVVNKCTTSPAGTPRTLRIHKPLDRNIIEITGDLPVGNSGYSGFVSVSRPAEMFAALLKQRLEAKGITVTGRAVAINDMDLIPADTTVEIAKVESPPLALIAAKTMKPSQNMYTETLLWTLGEWARARNGYPTVDGASGANQTSSELGRAEVKGFLKSIGVAEDAVMQYDGSGLSRHNLVTPSAVVELYTYMAKRSRYSQAWRDSLTVAGVDGTLRNRFRGTRGESNVRGKTGTINQVSALSGYVTTAAGEQLAFSALVNGVAETRTRVGLIDEIVTMLANYDGKVN
jgi:D-alanyl-D-alanine carboxypeptidase/D-alanyl-D-alanine-endopeptidase (penicillin-binding protein 4)